MAVKKERNIEYCDGSRWRKCRGKPLPHWSSVLTRSKYREIQKVFGCPLEALLVELHPRPSRDLYDLGDSLKLCRLRVPRQMKRLTEGKRGRESRRERSPARGGRSRRRPQSKDWRWKRERARANPGASPARSFPLRSRQRYGGVAKRRRRQVTTSGQSTPQSSDWSQSPRRKFSCTCHVIYQSFPHASCPVHRRASSQPPSLSRFPYDCDVDHLGCVPVDPSKRPGKEFVNRPTMARVSVVDATTQHQEMPVETINCTTQYSITRMPEVGCGTSDVGYLVHASGCNFPNINCRISAFSRRMPSIGCRVPAFSCRRPYTEPRTSTTCETFSTISTEERDSSLIMEGETNWQSDLEDTGGRTIAYFGVESSESQVLGMETDSTDQSSSIGTLLEIQNIKKIDVILPPMSMHMSSNIGSMNVESWAVYPAIRENTEMESSSTIDVETVDSTSTSLVLQDPQMPLHCRDGSCNSEESTEDEQLTVPDAWCESCREHVAPVRKIKSFSSSGRINRWINSFLGYVGFNGSNS